MENSRTLVVHDGVCSGTATRVKQERRSGEERGSVMSRQRSLKIASPNKRDGVSWGMTVVINFHSLYYFLAFLYFNFPMILCCALGFLFKWFSMVKFVALVSI